MLRRLYDQKLANHFNQLKEMAVRVNKQLKNAMTALENLDVELAQSVIESDQEINNYTTAIEKESYMIIATEQPVAGDLRLIFAVLLASVDLERMGDHASSIAEQVVQHHNTATSVDHLDTIVSEMAETALNMLTDIMQAFEEKDVEKAAKIARRDDIIDQGLQRVLGHSKEMLANQHTQPDASISYIRIANNIERIGDYITNICERVIYLETNTIIELS